MKRTGYLGITLFLLFALLLSALPSFGQAKQPQFKTRPEYDAAMTVYNEKDPVKRAAAGEKFVAEYKESEYVPTAYIYIIGAYNNSKNWAKTMEAADRAVALPNADNTLKEYSFEQAMVAAQNSNNVDQVISYGEKLLGINPNSLNAMITVSAIIPAKLPADEAAKKTALDKAEGLARKALGGIQQMAAQAEPQAKPQFVQIEGNLYSTLGLVAFNRQDYNKSIQEYEQALQRTPKDDVAHYYMALDYQMLGAQSSKDYTVALKEENDAKAARAEQPVIDELAAKRGGLEGDIKMYLDKAIDAFAVATALGGPVSGQAKDSLTKMWMNKNDSTDGLEDFVNEKKQQLK